MPMSQTEGYFENPWYCLEKPMLFLLVLKWNLEKAFFCVKQKPTQSLP